MKKALLLINLGTPRSTDPSDVGEYLTEFLTDKYVIDLPYIFRQFLVRALIVPKRKFDSAEKYKRVWLKEGSPLLVHTENISEKLDKALDQYDVSYAMRYGEPSILSQLTKLKDYELIDILPLYPHDTKSSITTALDAVKKASKKLKIESKINIIKPFYDKDFYIRSLATKIKSEVNIDEKDFILFSYHGIPVHHLPSKCAECNLDSPKDCKDSILITDCYRAQCYKTTDLVAKELGLPKEKFMTSFQSRLGKRPWIKPYTDLVIEDLKTKGVRKLAVLSPSFIADCLETLEELGIELKEDFEGNNTEFDLKFIPCMNDSDVFIKNLSEFLNT
ncbi:MAG: ferrochelatase [Bacteriovoracaceae bacterium]|jgi:ferrochelatase